MNTVAPLCKDCLREKRIATVHGPTCPHQEKSGPNWFPDWWHLGPFNPEAEARRCAWIRDNLARTPAEL
jgi:hypothetical protein